MGNTRYALFVYFLPIILGYFLFLFGGCNIGKIGVLRCRVVSCGVVWSPAVISMTVPIAQVIERPLREREVEGSKPGRGIPNALKMVPVATLLGAQHYKTSTGFSHSLLTQLTLHTHTKKLTPALGSPEPV